MFVDKCWPTFDRYNCIDLKSYLSLKTAVRTMSVYSCLKDWVLTQSDFGRMHERDGILNKSQSWCILALHGNIHGFAYSVFKQVTNK